MKRKVGLIVGYSGEGYHGLQWNKETHTIERAIMGVLLANGLVTELNATDPQKIDLKSGSRTDKGVHASFNVVQAKICQEPCPEVEARLREGLAPCGVRLYKVVRLPRRFVCHKMARSRVYRYTVPTYFLQASDFAAECLECLRRAEDDEPARPPGGARTREYGADDLAGIHGYRAPDVALFRELMGRYVGTHDFANFTARANSRDARRFVMGVSVADPVVVDDVEYVEVTIHGQSFLLHQIRKMVSFAVLNCRYARERAVEHFSRAFSQLLHIPKAPSQYLFLSHILFDDYNQRAVEKIEVDCGTQAEFENDVLLPLVHRPENLYEWLQFLDAVRFHHENFEIFK